MATIIVTVPILDPQESFPGDTPDWQGTGPRIPFNLTGMPQFIDTGDSSIVWEDEYEFAVGVSTEVYRTLRDRFVKDASMGGASTSTRASLAGYSYDSLFYENYHIFPASLDLETVLATVTTPFSLFNAYKNTHDSISAMDITGVGFDGTEVLSALTNAEFSTEAPYLIQALQHYTFKLRTPREGAQTIDYEVQPVMLSAGEIASLSVIGTRSLIFPFIPQTGVTEDIEYKTGVMLSKDGSETRTAERNMARQSFGMKYLLDSIDPQQYANLQALIIGQSGIPLGVGMWQQTRKITADANSGDLAVSVDTTGMDLRDGDFAMLWSEWNVTEIVKIVSLTDDTITIDSPLEDTWTTADTYLVPIQLCVAKDNVAVERYQNNTTQTTIQWESQDQTELASSALYSTLYLGTPVLDDPHLMSGSTLTDSLTSNMTTIDSGTGIRQYITDKPTMRSTTKRWDVETMEDTMALRRFFYWAKGKQKTFYVPTHQDDITPRPGQLIGTTGTTIPVMVTQGYAQHYELADPYKHIQITLHDGSIHYREIVEIASGTTSDSIVIDSTLGITDLNTDDIKQICFLQLTRLNADKVTLTHSGQGRVTTSVPLRGVKQ